MTTSGTYYVYEHWRLDRDECFYVGKGKGYRAYSRHSRNRFHRAICEKLKNIGSAFEVRMVATGLTEEEAFSIEIERIRFWREAGADLANATDGGEGVSGLKMSEASREKMRLKKLGKRHSPEVIERRAALLRGRKQKPEAIEKSAAWRRGRKLTQEHKEKISKAHKGKVTSQAARLALSLANGGKPWSEKRRAAYFRSKGVLVNDN
jgi:hypothetical protein